MSAPNPDPQGIYVISRGDLVSGLAAADDPVVQWLWSQLSFGGTSDPLDPPAVHRLALRYPGAPPVDDVDSPDAAPRERAPIPHGDDPGGTDAAA